MHRSLLKKILLWLSRVLGLISSGFFLLFFIGEGGLTKFVLELLPTIVFVGVAILGYVLTYFKKKHGAIMMAAGGIAQALYLLVWGGLSDLDAALIFCLPFLIPGILFYIVME